VGWINQKGGIEMSDTPRTDAAYFTEGATMYDLAVEAKKMERELNEANADRQRLREALTQAGAGQFLDTISATPPTPVVDKRDADALREVIAKVAENLRNAVRESHDIGDSYIAGTASELEKALKTYRTKYP
jgi:hypothetical protein